MIDRYTKVILTLIAGALLIIVVQNAVTSSRAGPDGCGSRDNPCFITTASAIGVVLGGSTMVLPVHLQ